MVLQNIIIPSERHSCGELYIRGGRAENGFLVLPAGEQASTDTYFNGFFYPVFLRNTVVESITFSIVFSGRLSAQLCLFSEDGEETVLNEADGNSGNAEKSRLEFVQNIRGLPEKGFLFIRLSALSECIFYGCAIESDCRFQKVSCCIAICTYRRERYVQSNLTALKTRNIDGLDRVFVIDNGGTLEESLSDDLVKILPNKNYGGSGGFTRGIIEAHDAEYSHVILMDDDIIFDPETVEKMIAFASVLMPGKQEAWISAAMLSKNVPYIQYEMAADWDGRTITHRKHGTDVRNRSSLVELLDNDGADYGAWWCLMMPVSVAERQGLPMPFFIKIDDLEYGLRRGKDTPVLTMCGIAVTHEDFSNKFSMHLDYYDNRNILVTHALTGIKGLPEAFYRLLHVCAKNLFLYRYDGIDLIIKAFEDFLDGADFFLRCDEEKLNKEILGMAPKPVPLSQVGVWDNSLRCSGDSDSRYFGSGEKVTTLQLLTIGNHLIPSFFMKKEPAVLPLAASRWKACERRRVTIQYQLGSNEGIVFKRSIKSFFGCCCKIVKMSFRLLFGYRKAAESFRAKAGELTSFDFWRKHLEI